MAVIGNGNAVVLVIGANSGIGKDVARQLALTDHYGTVILGCRDERKGADAKAELEASTGADIFRVLKFNLSDAHVERLAVATLGAPIDDLVMNAGGFGGSALFKTTRDGVAEMIAVNVLGHAVLLDALIERKLLTRAAVLAGSEGARGVPAMGIKRPAPRSGSVEEVVNLCDGSTFRSEKTDAASAYGMEEARRCAVDRTYGPRISRVEVANDEPRRDGGHVRYGFHAAFCTLPRQRRAGRPRVSALRHGPHSGSWLTPGRWTPCRRIQVGRLLRQQDKVTGPVVDQAMLYPKLGDVKLQDNEATAVQRFVKSSSVPATEASASQVAA